MRDYFCILGTVFVAILLSLLPMPEWAIWLRPVWVLMVLMYWVINKPDIVNVGLGFFVGIMMDFLTATAIGEHAIAYVAILYIISGLHHRLLHFPLWQQSACVFVFSITYQAIIYGIQGVMHELPNSDFYWGASLMTAILWPWLFVLLDSVRLRFRVC